MIIALNNKSNLNRDEFISYQEELKKIKSNSQLILCSTYLNINLFNANNIDLGSQNVSRTANGAYTGEVSASDLKNSNVKYSIIGHSERREYQKESFDDIHEKILRLFENNIIPILCIGESKEEREQNIYKEKLEKELLSAVEDLSNEDKDKIIIAYEPIWSIGTGIIPTNAEIKEVFDFIKNLFPNNKVLYGGSANDENIDTLKEIVEIDGYLLGGLSLKPSKLQTFIDKLETR